MFHVKQPFSVLISIGCSDVHFNVGVAGEERVPKVGSKTDAELQNALSDARKPGSKHSIWEF